MLHIYKASAGSGKTYTLAKDYITLLLAIKNPETGRYLLNLNTESGDKLLCEYPHRSILAITFTRKATEQMKRRIIEELSALSHIDTLGTASSNYAEEMMRTFEYRHAPVSAQSLAKTASIALEQLLFDYNNFNISTIDAFFQRVLHTFARELGHQADYTVEMDSKAAMRNAVGMMLDEFNVTEAGKTNEALEQWLQSFMDQQIQAGRQPNFFNRKSGAHNQLVNGVANISSESFKRVEKEMESYLSSPDFDVFLKTVETYKKNILEEIKAGAKKLKDQNLVHRISGNSSFKTKLDDLVQGKLWSEIDKKYKEAEKTAAKPSLADKIMDRASGSIFKKKDEDPAAEKIIKDFYQRYYKLHKSYESVDQLQEPIAQLGLLKNAWNYLLKFNKENNLVLISDTNSLIRDIIDKSSSPFIYERMGVTLKHFLIDEFQDTSAMQWENLEPLVFNGLAEEGESLIIGDEKQSIYRWRNSDSEILHSKLENSLPPLMKPKVTGGESTNYRSAHPIVKFNNSIFWGLANSEILASLSPNLLKEDGCPLALPSFYNVVQDLNKKLKNPDEAYIRFYSIDALKEKSQMVQGDDAVENGEDDEKVEDSSLKETILEQMAQEMLRQHQDGGYAWRDIAVLVRTNKEAVEVVNYLSSNYPEIKILSDESLHVSSSNAVQLIISILRILDGQSSEEVCEDEAQDRRKSKSEVMTQIHRIGYWLNVLIEKEKASNLHSDSIDDDTMAEIMMQAINNGMSPYNNDEDVLLQSIEGLKKKKPVSLVSIVETLIESLFSVSQRREQYSYISAFQDLVIEFCNQYQGSVHSFLDWWDTTGWKANISGAADADAAQVLTVHKAKGLEFDCVLIPFFTWLLFGNQNTVLWTKFPIPEISAQVAVPPALQVCLRKNANLKNNPLSQVYNEENQKKIYDTANVTYVAFTRAKRELIVWYGTPLSKTNSPLNPPVADLLKSVFALWEDVPKEGKEDLLMDISAPSYNPETCEFIWGEPTVNHNVEFKEKNTLVMEDYYPVYFPSHASSIIEIDNILDLERDLNEDDMPREESSPRFMSPEEEEAIATGILLHEIMSHIYTLEDIQDAVELVRSRRHLSNEQADEYWQVVSNFLMSGDERISHWFGQAKRVYIEQQIYSSGTESHTRRPDRLIIHNDGTATVLDYKFTKDLSQTNNLDYHAQVREYMALARDLGYREVKGFLCFPLLDRNKIIEVKP